MSGNRSGKVILVPLSRSQALLLHILAAALSMRAVQTWLSNFIDISLHITHATFPRLYKLNRHHLSAPYCDVHSDDSFVLSAVSFLIDQGQHSERMVIQHHLGAR